MRLCRYAPDNEDWTNTDGSVFKAGVQTVEDVRFNQFVQHQRRIITFKFTNTTANGAELVTSAQADDFYIVQIIGGIDTRQRLLVHKLILSVKYAASRRQLREQDASAGVSSAHAQRLLQKQDAHAVFSGEGIDEGSGGAVTGTTTETDPALVSQTDKNMNDGDSERTPLDMAFSNVTFSTVT